jgi:hypothetical protein
MVKVVGTEIDREPLTVRLFYRESVALGQGLVGVRETTLATIGLDQLTQHPHADGIALARQIAGLGIPPKLSTGERTDYFEKRVPSIPVLAGVDLAPPESQWPVLGVAAAALERAIRRAGIG